MHVTSTPRRFAAPVFPRPRGAQAPAPPAARRSVRAAAGVGAAGDAATLAALVVPDRLARAADRFVAPTTQPELDRFVDARLYAHFRERGHLRAAAAYHATYRERGVVEIPDVLPKAMHAAALRSLLTTARVRGVVRNGANRTSGTPRHFVSLGNPQLRETPSIHEAIYRSPTFRWLVSRGFGEKNRPLPERYALDRYTATIAHAPGHTMGYHFDPKNTAVLVYQAPPADAGARVRYCRLPPEAFAADGTIETRRVAALVERYADRVETLAPRSNSVYLMPTSTTPHAVDAPSRPIPERPRVIAALCYDQTGDRRPQAAIDRVYADEVADSFPEARRPAR